MDARTREAAEEVKFEDKVEVNTPEAEEPEVDAATLRPPSLS